MKRTRANKLLLSRETVRRLDSTDLGMARGAGPAGAASLLAASAIISNLADRAVDAITDGIVAASKALSNAPGISDNLASKAEQSQGGMTAMSLISGGKM